MDHAHHDGLADCDACQARTPIKAPSSTFFALIVSFWIVSGALGFASVTEAGWGFLAALSWTFLATGVVLFARKATTYTCSECGSTVTPLVTSPSFARRLLPKAGAFRAMQPRHA